MRFVPGFMAAAFFPGLVLTGLSSPLFSQQASITPATHATVVVAWNEIPEAPVPNISGTTADDAQQTQQPAQNPPTGQDSSSSGPAPQSTDQQSQHDKAAQQIKAQEKQRILGILPSFNVSYDNQAVSLTGRQKISLAFHGQMDPYAFGVALIVAGLDEAENSNPGFGWGAAGYGKRAGAHYLDAFDGAMIGNGFLPAILHQDPRYFRLGHGSATRRLLYAAASSFICKHDNTGKWQPNYSNIGGNIASGAISTLYYPSSSGSGIGHTISDGLTVTAEGAFGSALQEFWPDISRKFFHKDPTNGLDAKARDADKAKKAARQSSK